MAGSFLLGEGLERQSLPHSGNHHLGTGREDASMIEIFIFERDFLINAITRGESI
jgi:hypothetical protein